MTNSASPLNTVWQLALLLLSATQLVSVSVYHSSDMGAPYSGHYIHILM